MCIFRVNCNYIGCYQDNSSGSYIFYRYLFGQITLSGIILPGA